MHNLTLLDNMTARFNRFQIDGFGNERVRSRLVGIPKNCGSPWPRSFSFMTVDNYTMAKCRLVIEESSFSGYIHPGHCSHTDLVYNLLLWRAATNYSSLDISPAYMRLKIADDDQLSMVSYAVEQFCVHVAANRRCLFCFRTAQ